MIIIENIDKRIKEYSKLINKYPDKKELYIERAKLYDAKGEHKKAVEDFKMTLPGYYSFNDIKDVCEKANLLKDAENFYTKEINKDKNNICGYISRLRFYMRTDQFEKVILDCQNILKLSSANKTYTTLKDILTKEV